jgi:hypothetical protein
MAKNRARQTRTFLVSHPWCIFCGGIARSETRDHVPSRQTFHLKDWPEGYEFPACSECNQATKHAEQVMALISRMHPDGKSAAERLEVKHIFQAVKNNYPDVLRELRATPAQRAEYLAKPWLPELIKAGKAAPEPLSLRGPLVAQCAATLARKLFTALHYKEFGKIVPAEGGIWWKWYSNVQRLDNAMPDDLIGLMRIRPTIQRTRRDLSDQFVYTYAKAEDGDLAGYFATFRQSFAMIGVIEMDADRFDPAVRSEVIRPFRRAGIPTAPL